MASQPLARLDGLDADAAALDAAETMCDASLAEEGWRAFHLFYHQDHDRLLSGLVAPLVAGLLASGWIDRFHFVRYNLGGPHVRLRWRAVDGPAAAEEVLAAAAEDFFARSPSTESLPNDVVRKLNRSVLAVDPLARPEDDVVHPDNSWRAVPVRFEVERYGGPRRLGDTLELFTASSARALELLDERRSLTAGQAQAGFVRLLTQMAAAFAGSEGELFELTGYGVRFMGSAFAPCVGAADRFFADRREELTALVANALEPPALLDEPLAEAARRFAPAIVDLEPKKRWHIAASHIHMTANRVGLLNADEVYLSRIAERAVRRLATSDRD